MRPCIEVLSKTSRLSHVTTGAWLSQPIQDQINPFDLASLVVSLSTCSYGFEASLALMAIIKQTLNGLAGSAGRCVPDLLLLGEKQSKARSVEFTRARSQGKYVNLRIQLNVLSGSQSSDRVCGLNRSPGSEIKAAGAILRAKSNQNQKVAPRESMDTLSKSETS